MAAGEDGPAPDTTPGGILNAFFALDPLDKEAAERLRMEHCTVCRGTLGLHEEMRMGQCLRVYRCGLRSPGEIDKEQGMLDRLGRALEGPDPDQAVRLLSSHIGQHAAVTPQLDRLPTGGYTLGYRALT